MIYQKIGLLTAILLMGICPALSSSYNNHLLTNYRTSLRACPDALKACDNNTSSPNLKADHIIEMAQQALPTVSSICVTPYQGGVAAWFSFQPPNYGSTAPFQLVNLKQCSSHQISDVPHQLNNMKVTPLGWSVTTYMNGSKIYMMNGRIQ